MPIDVETLVHDHKKAIATIDGVEFHMVPGMLEQLREAMFEGTEATGGSRPGAKLPISASALDLYMIIDRQISEAWVAAFKRVPNADRPELLVSQWAAWADADTIVTVDGRDMYAPDAAARWETMIEEYLNPPKSAEIDAPCLACGQQWIYRMRDGETIRSTALTFTRSRETGETLDARCGVCNAIWYPHQFDFIGKAIGIDVDRKRKEFFEGEAAAAAKAAHRRMSEVEERM